MTENDLSSSPNRNRIAGHENAGSAIRPAERAQWLAAAAISALVLTIARTLTPDPRGFGTHTQLGLPACFFLRWTGLPCPACGLTTCFAHMAHGELSSALRCHPVGVILFTATCLGVPAFMYAAVRGSAASATSPRMQALAALACVWLAQWLTRIACLLLTRA